MIPLSLLCCSRAVISVKLIFISKNIKIIQLTNFLKSCIITIVRRKESCSYNHDQQKKGQKKMEKRMISALLALAVVAGGTAAPVSEFANIHASADILGSTDGDGLLTYEDSSEPEEDTAPEADANEVSTSAEDFEYQIWGDTVTITAYLGHDSDVSVPAKIDGKKVTKIGQQAFFGDNEIKNVKLPSGIVSIELCAFYQCSALQKINIPAGVKKIGNNAFDGCKKLESIKFPAALEKIERAAFNNCSSLKSVTIPAGVKKIEPSVFANCDDLRSIKVDSENAKFTSVNGVLFNKEKTRLHAYPAGNTSSEYTVPDSVKTIGECAFSNCRCLEKVTISNGVKKTEYQAFSFCTNLKSVIIPDSMKTIGDASFYGCTKLQSAVIPDGVTAIENDTFYACNSLKSVTIPDSVKSIGICAFSMCESLESIKIPDGLTEIKAYSFYGCISLKDVTIPDGVKFIYEGAFQFCEAVTNVTIPASVTSVEILAFDGCHALTDVNYGGKLKQWNKINFGDANNHLLNANLHCTDADLKGLYPAVIKVSNKTYTGKALMPAVKVTIDGKKLTEGTDYTLTYEHNKRCGEAYAIAKGKGDYTGTAWSSFLIKPKKVTAKKLTSPKTGSVKLTWSLASGGVNGYQVQVAANKSFTSGVKTAWVKNGTNSGKTVKGLKKGKKYYARVRAYVSTSRNKCYGAWSVVKSVKCK